MPVKLIFTWLLLLLTVLLLLSFVEEFRSANYQMSEEPAREAAPSFSPPSASTSAPAGTETFRGPNVPPGTGFKGPSGNPPNY